MIFLLGLICALFLCRSSILVVLCVLAEEHASKFISEGDQPKFEPNPKIERTFRRNKRRRRRRQGNRMETIKTNKVSLGTKLP